MSRFSCLLVLSLFLAPVQSAETYARVDFILRCEKSSQTYRYTAKLIEVYQYWYTNDLIAQNSGEAWGQQFGHVSGIDNGDGWFNNYYEFMVEVQHNCTGEKRTMKRPLPDCHVDSPRCKFNKQYFYLD